MKEQKSTRSAVVVGYVIAPQVLASASQGSGPLMARGLQVTEVTAAIPKASGFVEDAVSCESVGAC